jgi:calcineurin-like phosphoesterase family protein
MNIIRREFPDSGRSDVVRIIPLGDVHLGSAACQEDLFRRVVDRIAEDDNCYWLGMGDYCEFLNRSDPRFDPNDMADWFRVAHLADLAKAQRDRFLEIVRPIAGKCLALVEGNHEHSIRRHYERDIYSDIVTDIKEGAGHPADYKLALGVCGWLLLHFRRPDGKSRRTFRFNLHHGFVGGKLAGAKALNMQRWLWTHDADLVIFGHSHNTGIQVETVESVTVGGHVHYQNRVGCYGGSFMVGAQYAQRKGYFPIPLGHVEIVLRPGARYAPDRLTVMTGA